MNNGKQVDLKELIRNEYKKCCASPAYFIRKYCMIQHPKRGRILFDLFKYQEDSINDFEAYQYNIILKGRQIGISTAVACYALWMMLFFKDKNVLVIATKQDTAKNLVTKVKFAFDNLPVWLQNPCVENNKLGLRFENGSQIKAVTAAGDSGRSEALSLLIMDEAAFIRNAEEIWVAALPTLSTGGKAVLISTPNGVGNFFHKMYSQAIQKQAAAERESDGLVFFNPIKLDWRVHPERDQKWRDQMGSIQGERAARQEYDAEFIGSGNTVIDADLIEWYAQTTVKDPIAKGGFDGNVWIWEHTDYDKGNYILTADVARGDGTDYSAFHIIDVERNTQVAEYKGKVDTKMFANMIVEWATIYNDALVIVERENQGWAVLQQIIDRQYKNLFYMSKDRQVIEVEKNLTNRWNTEEKRMLPGFGTSHKSRPLIINKLDTYMREADQETGEVNFVIRSLRTIEELRVFIWETNGKAQAQQGYNDDLVMSLAIGLWVRDTALKLFMEGINITRSALDGIRRTNTSDLLYTPGHLPADPYRIQIGNQTSQNNSDFEDIRWLLG